MGPVEQVASPGVVLAVACGLVVAAGLVVAVVLARASRRRRTALDAALARSRAEVESLCRRVDELSDEVLHARRTADRDREYVITSLGGDELEGRADGLGAALAGDGAGQGRETHRVGKALEDQLVQALARQPRSSPLRARGIDLVVRAVALGHGVRRALSADVLDRAAAEAHVARRRSRRDRRRLVREARRMVRTDQPQGRDVA